MSLDAHLNAVLDSLLLSKSHNSALLSCLDLTLLDPNASNDALVALYKNAEKYGVAALCILSNHLCHLPKTHRALKLATVVNFPEGCSDINSCLDEIKKAKALGVEEIDYVFPYKTYLSGDKKQALEHSAKVMQACKENGLRIKIIMETGTFPTTADVYALSKELILLGCDFLKTSTGKTPQGASLSAAFAILSAIKDTQSNCGIKISGGVKTPEQANQYAALAQLIANKPIHSTWFRIGASSLLDALI